MRPFIVKKSANSTYAGMQGWAVMYGNAVRNWIKPTSKAKYVCLVFDGGEFPDRPMWFNQDEVRSKIAG